MLDNWATHVRSMQYIRFLEDTGVEHIGSIMRWVYFRKKTSGDAFDLYSDIGSRISHLNRMLLLLGVLMAANAINTFNMLHSWIRAGAFLAPTTAVITFAVFLLVGYGFIRIFIKKRKLKKEKLLRE